MLTCFPDLLVLCLYVLTYLISWLFSNILHVYVLGILVWQVFDSVLNALPRGHSKSTSLIEGGGGGGGVHEKK